MPIREFHDYLFFIEVAAAVFAAARLLQCHLWRRFRFLFLYLLVIALFDLVFSSLPLTSRAYFRIFLAFEPLALLAAILTVFEMFTTIFGAYPGLRTAGKWATWVALGLSGGISVYITQVLEPGQSSPHARWLFYELVMDRSVHFSLTAIVVVLLIVLSRYPLKLDHNVPVASGFFSTIFLSQAVVSLIDSISPHLFAVYVDYPQLVFEALCFFGLGLMLRPAGALNPARSPADPARELVLLHQLDAMNEVLTRSVRR